MPSICYQFADSGFCRYGENCRFSHLATPKKPRLGKAKRRRKNSKNVASSATDHLDDFFSQYPEFSYQRNEPSSQEFYKLCGFFEWDRDDPEQKQAHEDFKTALVHQFNSIYGTNVNDMESWRKLCLALEISPLPNDVVEARKTVKGLFVNLVDLTDMERTGETVEKFSSLQDLQDYTIRMGRFFPRESAYAGGVLKYLLREILNGHRFQRK